MTATPRVAPDAPVQSDPCCAADRDTDGPVISVVSPFHNRRGWLPVYLGTLEGQTFSNFEVVIVDDGSTDGLIEIIGKI